MYDATALSDARVETDGGEDAVFTPVRVEDRVATEEGDAGAVLDTQGVPVAQAEGRLLELPLRVEAVDADAQPLLVAQPLPLPEVTGELVRRAERDVIGV